MGLERYQPALTAIIELTVLELGKYESFVETQLILKKKMNRLLS